MANAENCRLISGTSNAYARMRPRKKAKRELRIAKLDTAVWRDGDEDAVEWSGIEDEDVVGGCGQRR